MEIEEIKRIKVRKGDIVVIRSNSLTESQFSYIYNFFNEQQIPVIFMPAEVNIDIVSKEKSA